VHLHLRKYVSVFFILALTIAATIPVQAQQYLGTLSGTVTDSSGANVVGAVVTATDVTTSFTTKVVTNGSGGYTIPFLTPDTYEVTISSGNFRTEKRTGIVLTAGASTQTDFVLKAGSQSQSVEVTAETQLLDTSSANLATTFSTSEVTDTPNVGRNPFVLSTLAAGIYYNYFQGKASTFTNPFSGAAVQINSNGGSGHSRLTLDGIPDDPSERLSGSSYTGFVPSPEAVQEVKVQTAIYDAQFGHGSGVVTNTVLRAGSSKFHGSAYDVFRNTYMNANTFERVPTQKTAPAGTPLTPRSSDQWQQPGGVFDGPVWIPHVYNGRDKTFFMVAYEYLQLHQTLPYQTLVPTAAMVGGDFSGLCSNFNSSGVCAPGAGIQIYDPTSVTSGTGNRTPFANNKIPASRINAAGAAYLSYIPTPNSTFSPTINYISSNTSVPNRYYSFATRVDHQFSDRQHLDATFFKAVLHQFEPNEGFPKAIGPTGTGYTVYRNNEGGSIEDSYVFSPTLVANARFGVIYHPFGLVYPGNTFNLASINITATGLPYQSFPGSTFSDNYLANYINNPPSAGGLAAGNTGQISEDALGSTSLLVAKTLQKHSLRVGFEGNLSRYNVQNPQSGIGVFSFNRQFTQQNSSGATGSACTAPNCTVGGDTASGNPIASLLLGYPSSGTYGNTIAYAMQQKYIAFYVQDDWRVTNKLTVNAGLRWDYESPFSERYNRLNAGFCATCVSPLQPSVVGLTLNGGLTFVGTSASPSRYAAQQKYANFQPRFGAAYQITPKIVARGGAGLIYYNTQDSPLSQGFSNNTAYVSTTNSVLPSNSLSNPWPTGVVLPTGNTLGLSTQLGQGITYPDPNAVQPKIWQWSTSLQFQLPYQTALQIAYVGNKVTRLPINKQVDALPASFLGTSTTPLTTAQNAALTANVTNPMAGLIPGSSLSNATVQQYLLDVPYPEFTSVTDNYLPAGSALYNALQITITKPLSHHFEIQGNVTYSKIMDETAFLNPQNTTPLRFQDNQPNILANVWGTYHFPDLKGKPAYMRLPLGGWKLQGVVRAADGALIANPGATGGSQYGTSTTFTQIRSPKTATRSYTRYFNTCWINAAGVLQPTTNTLNPTTGVPTTVPGCDASSPVPAFQQNPNFTLNNIGPYMNLRQFVHPLADASLFKQFHITESTTFELRGEFFNVLNTPLFAGPGTTPGNSSYGLVTQVQANDPRLTQLTVRINF
jgi:Carboxypeptidase regulatory-like domain/TonB dependent receptor